MANQDSEKVFDCRDTLEGQGLSGNWLEMVHSLVKPVWERNSQQVKPVWDREVKAFRKANLNFDSPPVPGRPDHKRMVLPIWEQQNLVGDINEEMQDVNELN